MVLARTKQRRELRHNSTPAEKVFWAMVSAKQFNNLKFRRQHDIGPYIVDFYCAALNLIIEIDGDSHFTTQGIDYDKTRTKYLISKGYQIIRYDNSQILNNLDGVFADLTLKLALRPSPNPSLPGRGTAAEELL